MELQTYLRFSNQVDVENTAVQNSKMRLPLVYLLLPRTNIHFKTMTTSATSKNLTIAMRFLLDGRSAGLPCRKLEYFSYSLVVPCATFNVAPCADSSCDRFSLQI